MGPRLKCVLIFGLSWVRMGYKGLLLRKIERKGENRNLVLQYFGWGAFYINFCTLRTDTEHPYVQWISHAVCKHVDTALIIPLCCVFVTVLLGPQRYFCFPTLDACSRDCTALLDLHTRIAISLIETFVSAYAWIASFSSPLKSVYLPMFCYY